MRASGEWPKEIYAIAAAIEQTRFLNGSAECKQSLIQTFVIYNLNDARSTDIFIPCVQQKSNKKKSKFTVVNYIIIIIFIKFYFLT